MVVYNKGEPFIFLYITLGIMLTLDPKSQSAFLKVEAPIVMVMTGLPGSPHVGDSHKGPLNNRGNPA
jgi:hypothetical protein